MAYNNYFPATYQPNYYGSPNPYAYQQMQQQQAMMQQQAQQQAQQQNQPVTNFNQQPQAIQQSGFVLVQSEQEARAYPVAPGNSITFKDETAPFCYVKTMGFNQLDRPTFERYRLVKEDTPSEAQNATTTNASAQQVKHTNYATKDDLSQIWDELDALKEKLKAQTEKRAVKARKIDKEAEVSDDE